MVRIEGILGSSRRDRQASEPLPGVGVDNVGDQFLASLPAATSAPRLKQNPPESGFLSLSPSPGRSRRHRDCPASYSWAKKEVDRRPSLVAPRPACKRHLGKRGQCRECGCGELLDGHTGSPEA